MIIGKIHPGSGLGDQLFSYITTRTIALDKGLDFGFVGIENFKGKDFMHLDWGKPVDLKYHTEMPSGKLVIDEEHKLFEINTPYYDPNVNFIEDGTVIDACSAQDERYWGHRLDEIREWLKVEPWNIPDDVCVINFRGGEYAAVPDLFLTKEYWQGAINVLFKNYPNIKFEVHTDDKIWASNFFRGIPIIKDIEKNWTAIRYAKHLILSNSAFGIIPRLLKHLEDPKATTIAPFGWNARNKSLTKWEGRPINYYKKFLYI